MSLGKPGGSEKLRLATFGEAAASRAAREGIASRIDKLHAAEGAAQAVAEGATHALAVNDLVADPYEKNPRKDHEEAGEDEPGEFERDHWAAGARTSAPQ